MKHPVVRGVFADRMIYRPSKRTDISGVLGWGRKANTRAANRYASSEGLPMVRLEDGFIRSVGLGVDKSVPFSLVIDDLGIYYDATRPSRLERILSAYDFAGAPSLKANARGVRDFICKYHISKYNLYHDAPNDVISGSSRTKVLVVAQTDGDLSLKYGRGEEVSNEEMLSDMYHQYPDAEFYLKVHPDVLSGKRRSSIDIHKAAKRCRIISESFNPISLLKRVDVVCTKTSQMGYEALILGKKVHCFGMPFYAGWGLTEDRLSCERRKKNLTVDDLVAGTTILYSRYHNPLTGEAGDVFDTLETIKRHRDLKFSNKGTKFFVNFSGWKRFTHTPFFSSGLGEKNRFIKLKRKESLSIPKEESSSIYVWGGSPTQAELGCYHDINVFQVEDGFLRSVSLGSDLTQPYSLVVDSRGIYFDPSAPSDLEHILNSTDFKGQPRLVTRAQALIERICQERMTKYNFQKHKDVVVSGNGHDKVILVPGQVEDDASVKLAGFGMTNEKLLTSVREENPSAFIIYKPHPDVISGNRKGHISQKVVSECANIVECHASLDSCLNVSDEVHTISSLCGFDALIRKKRVTVWGMPFYSGWGLTIDKQFVSRRNRILSLEELVAGALIL
ncbi:MAG: capsular polysaccharide biosynthesis protein, partial [Desulfovibrionales bacterium]|nr:capsular polysaccharide biosynthesis protein [Desulfovibrionales bacterium]